MPKHHKVFAHFKPFYGHIPGCFDVDSFLGTKNRQMFQGSVTRSEDVTLPEDYPKFNDEYFEWIDLLESVVAAERAYTMIELGAGYGRWSVRAAHAVKQYNNLPLHLIAVEAEPVHFEWMKLHFSDNGIDPSQHRLIHAAVSETAGRVAFCIGGPHGGPFDQAPNVWYGQALAKDDEIAWRSIQVPTVSLCGLLRDLQQVDLIDIDIEGQELRAIRPAIEAIDAKVKRLHIGTHGREIEDELRRLLDTHGWRCLAEYPIFSEADTSWGKIFFDNGVQSWVNTRL